MAGGLAAQVHWTAGGPQGSTRGRQGGRQEQLQWAGISSHTVTDVAVPSGMQPLHSEQPAHLVFPLRQAILCLLIPPVLHVAVEWVPRQIVSDSACQGCCAGKALASFAMPVQPRCAPGEQDGTGADQHTCCDAGQAGGASRSAPALLAPRWHRPRSSPGVPTDQLGTSGCRKASS